ncbi:hypothetical protein TNIN_24081 [Trichonephila inaurata madagascariensis]|uniref:Uncharacterized protein n=1 Tax=Trichonephila inaurata madagascariensis TaxID=2747483 RepID=A0A8X7CJT7_9ARAC|nr:hypothetical protein TNIN_24081 [Trichonephila inaurata madagascariensis]
MAENLLLAIFLLCKEREKGDRHWIPFLPFSPAREEMRVEESTHSELEMSEGLPENPEPWLWQRHGEASHVLGNRAMQKFPDP